MLDVVALGRIISQLLVGEIGVPGDELIELLIAAGGGGRRLGLRRLGTADGDAQEK
jgi:hypothetical protein